MSARSTLAFPHVYAPGSVGPMTLEQVQELGLPEYPGDEDLSGFDSTQENDGECQVCALCCRRTIEPWVWALVCQGCVWDEAGAR